MKQYELYAKPSKYNLFKRSLVFFSHIISADRVQPNPKKIKAIVDLLRPTNILTLQSFIVLVTFVQKFILNYSELISLLTALLRKNVFLNRILKVYLMIFPLNN